MKVYISGKITGLPSQEAEAKFKTAEDHLSFCGYKPVNPMTLNHGHKKTWEDYMIEDIKALMDCQAIYMLNNWETSKGARVERAIALEMKMVIMYQV